MIESYSGNDIRLRVGRARRIAEEARRWLRRYQIVHSALLADGLASPTALPELPRPDQVGRLSAVTVAGEARRYLDAVAPNVATPTHVRRYVERCTGAAYTAGTVNSALKKLIDLKHARQVGHGQYVSTAPSHKAPQANDKLPEINPEGLQNEVRRLLLIHGTLQTEPLLALIGEHFSISGNPIDNFYTIIGKTLDIEFLLNHGYVLCELVSLQPELAVGLHHRHHGTKTFRPRGLAKAQQNRRRKAAQDAVTRAESDNDEESP